MRKLSLVRHGRSSYVQRNGWFTYSDMLDWRAGYDAAGIRDDDPAPLTVRTLAQEADLVVASDLPRAIETAGRLVDVQAITTSVLLREAHQALPDWKRVRLPRHVWEQAMLVRWLYQINRGTDINAEDEARGVAAADWLEGLLEGREHLLVVTHGMFRRVLRREFERRGWQREETRQTYANWSVWTLTEA